MANLYKADGTELVVAPYAKNKKWTLEELQAFVGGPIERMPGLRVNIIMDEEANLRGKPVNARATELVGILIARTGKPTWYSPTLHGDVLFLTPGESM